MLCKQWNVRRKYGRDDGSGVGYTNLSKGWSQINEETTAGKAGGYSPHDDASYDGTGEVAGAAGYIESRLVNTTAEQLQSRVTAAAAELGVKAPATYDPSMGLLNRGYLSPDKGILVGRAALVTDWQLRTTLVHEEYHVLQLTEGRFAGTNARYAGMINEIEARYATLSSKNVERTGITDWGRRQVLNEITGLRDQLASGVRPQARFYYGRLMEKNFQNLPEHVNTSPRPNWLS